ncbi:hypothetical protein SB461_08985 [Burkholderia cenocepacia]|uniref:hypothetical protein n=1 Tax=Burkholderia cenocepacia TaxID=95486 RepID=UPI002B2553D5|nr:hypothetical protein [Burkholderia cenocepacia]MEB2606635.1 hypothetical protein [Burkholderia cenocepacia]
MRFQPPARAGGNALASQFFILLSGLSKSAQLEMICVIDKKENLAIKENQQIRDLSMHFHIAEMRNGQSAMAVWGLIVSRVSTLRGMYRNTLLRGSQTLRYIRVPVAFFIR